MKASINRMGPLGVVVNALLFLLAAVFLVPFVLMILTTFKQDRVLFDALSLPDFRYWDNYRQVFAKSSIGRAFLNTIIICGSTITVNILVASMAGYAVSRSREIVFKVAYVIMVLGLIIPVQTNIMVVFKIGTATGLINTIPFLVMIYVAGSVSFAVLLYAGFTRGIPHELEEAARIDGCGVFQTFGRIIFPLLLPATGTIIVTTIFWYWNDFIGPLVYLNRAEYRTLIMEIYHFKTSVAGVTAIATNWGPTFALCFLASLPMIVFFLFTQKYLIVGLTSGAVKG